MEILIRPFGRDDIDPLYFLEQRCAAPGGRLTYERLLKVLLEPQVTAVVMVEDMQATAPPMLGGLIVRADAPGSRLDVLALMVDPEFRRLGLARKLMAWAIHLGANRGLAEIAALEEGEAAPAFLTALGFARTGELVPGFGQGEPRPRWKRPAGEIARVWPAVTGGGQRGETPESGAGGSEGDGPNGDAG